MRSDDACLLDMLPAREAAKFAAGRTFPEFERDRMTQLAILKAVEIVGEAASHVSTATKEAHPEIPCGPRSSACGIVLCAHTSK